MFVLVSAKNNDWDKADNDCFNLAQAVVRNMNLHFHNQLSWIKRQSSRAGIANREVMMCRLEFAKSLTEVMDI